MKGARLVLVDDELVRAPVVAGWLRQLGHDACVLAGGIAAAGGYSWRRSGPPVLDALRSIAPHEAVQALARGSAQVIDLRPAMAYRQGHIPQAVWSIRPRIAAAAGAAKTAGAKTAGAKTAAAKIVILVAEAPAIAALAAVDLGEAGCGDVRMLEGGFPAWQAAGLAVAATPDVPADPDCIDFLFFTARRHDNDPDAARQYLTWETGLLGRLDAQERGIFFSLAGAAGEGGGE